MNDGKITVDGKEFLDSLAEVFDGVRGILKSLDIDAGELDALMKKKPEAPAPVPEKKPEPEAPKPEPEAPAPAPEKKTEPEAPKAEMKPEPVPAPEKPRTLAYEQVVNIVGAKISKSLEAGDKTINKRVKDLVMEFGVKKLPELPEEKYEEFLAKLEEI